MFPLFKKMSEQKEIVALIYTNKRREQRKCKKQQNTETKKDRKSREASNNRVLFLR